MFVLNYNTNIKLFFQLQRIFCIYFYVYFTLLHKKRGNKYPFNYNNGDYYGVSSAAIAVEKVPFIIPFGK